MIQGYVSRTGSRRTLESLWHHGWRLLVNPYGEHRCEGFGYALESGTVRVAKGNAQDVEHREDWDPGRFVALLERYGEGADFIVVPDIVKGGVASLRRSETWLPRVAGFGLPLIVVQDGMVGADVWPLVGPRCGIFIGGSRTWKASTLHQWGALARERGCHLHVGRINSAKRIALCQEAGAQSFDGRCALYEKHHHLLTEAAHRRSDQLTIHDLPRDHRAHTEDTPY